MGKNNSCGYDKIPLHIIKKIYTFDKLVHIMNCSFVEGGFPPELLKQTIVKPLHTMGDADSLGNNRPISLLTSFAKIFELVLSMRLFHFFRKLNVIADSQHGFSKGKTRRRPFSNLSEK